MNTPDSLHYIAQGESQTRQFIDAETVFLALQSAQLAAKEVRGSMFWRVLRGKNTLIQTTAHGAQTSLGIESDTTRLLFEAFIRRKSALEERRTALAAQLLMQTRLNRALRVGRVPTIVVDVLNAFCKAGLDEHFMVIGTHALYAYEQAAGVRINEKALATRDVDFLFDARKRVAFVSAIGQLDGGLIGVLKKADASFEIVEGQLYTARNKDGFEVDVLRLQAAGDDPHPWRLSDNEDDFWAVQISTEEKLQSARRFDQVVVATSGSMGLMRTIHPLDFARIKQNLGNLLNRDPNKSGKDLYQAQLLRVLVDERLPHLALKPETDIDPIASA